MRCREMKFKLRTSLSKMKKKDSFTKNMHDKHKSFIILSLKFKCSKLASLIKNHYLMVKIEKKMILMILV